MAQSIIGMYPDVHKESGLNVIQWLQKCQEIPLTTTWGGDIELCLLAIGMQRDLVVLTATSNQTCTFFFTMPLNWYHQIISPSRLTVVSRAAKKPQNARPIKRRAATTVSYLRVGPVSQY